MAAAKVLDKPGHALGGLSLQRESGHLESHDPTFGAGFQGGDIAGCERQTHDLVEKDGCLTGCEAQVVDPDLYHLASRPPPGEGEGWIDAGGDDQVHVRWQPLDEKGDTVVDGLGVDGVVVIEDKHGLCRIVLL